MRYDVVGVRYEVQGGILGIWGLYMEHRIRYATWRRTEPDGSEESFLAYAKGRDRKG